MAADPSGRSYELFVQALQRRILAEQDLTVEVLHNKRLPGRSGAVHQIDLYWEYRLGGVLHRVAIDCKDYTTRIKKEKVLAAVGLMQDLPGIRSVLVTRSDFQKGAVAVAKHYGVGLKVIRPPVPADYDGRIQEIVIQLDLRHAEVTGAKAQVDAAWATATGSEYDDGAIRSLLVHSGLAYIEEGAGRRRALQQLISELPVLELDPLLPHSFAYRFADAFLHAPGAAPAKISAFQFDYTIANATSRTSTGTRPADSIVWDAITGTLLFVDEEGITGDTEEEFGH